MVWAQQEDDESGHTTHKMKRRAVRQVVWATYEKLKKIENVKFDQYYSGVTWEMCMGPGHP